jgi:tetratricopeptide (TPR) repeat protein
MKQLFPRNVYVFLQILSLLMPLSGYMIDFKYRTSPAAFIVCTIIGLMLFIWSYIRYKKAGDKKDPRAVDWIGKGCTMQIAGNHQEAIIAFTKACELEAGVVLAYYARGRSYWEVGNLDQAIKDFNKVIELNPKFVEAYDKRGLCHAKLGNQAKAIEDFDKAIALNSKFSVAYNNRGVAYGMMGNHEQEIIDIQAAARLGLKSAQTLLKSKGLEW